MATGDAVERAKRITTVVLDVDGVLTDGSILLDADGREIKRFHVQDGTGIKYLQRAGYRVVILSGRSAPATAHRAQELAINDTYQGLKDKIDGYRDLKSAYSLADVEIACVGDDLPDVPLMRAAGLAVAVANARPEVKAMAHYTTAAAGGHGAVREFCEWLLKAAGKWDAIMKRYLPGEGAGDADA